MARKILLIEPNYKNKYPPMGLMKLSTYHKKLGDSVRFYKGDFSTFVLESLYLDFLDESKAMGSGVDWSEHKGLILGYIKRGFSKNLEHIERLDDWGGIVEVLGKYRSQYLHKDYLKNPKWDRICITSLFTFHWQVLVETINSFKLLCKSADEVLVGGIAASVVPEDVKSATGISPHIGLLDVPGVLDDNEIVIDHLPLDYSILTEIDYVYPENNGYYAYMTRGCPNRCRFCAVPTLEPAYQDYINLKSQIEYVDRKFGQKRNLLLLDNNVLASDRFDDIIDEIKACGFGRGAKYTPPNEYETFYRGLLSGDNDRGYVKAIVKQYDILQEKISGEDSRILVQLLASNKLLHPDTATKASVLAVHDDVKELFSRVYKKRFLARYVDFNQGVDARRLTEDKVKKLAEIAIKPLRIAFDSYRSKDVYEKAVRTAAKHGIRSMSNYLLYNFEDEPIELYKRLKLNVELCDELGVGIYSFPMKYHPIKDPAFFKNRNYIGIHWNKKFIRAVQAILNATKGKIGKGLSFFYEAFGKTEDEFFKLMYMPEAFIVYRFYYKDTGQTEDWWNDYQLLSTQQRGTVNQIIETNTFGAVEEMSDDPMIQQVLSYYKITRDTPRDRPLRN